MVKTICLSTLFIFGSALANSSKIANTSLGVAKNAAFSTKGRLVLLPGESEQIGDTTVFCHGGSQVSWRSLQGGNYELTSGNCKSPVSIQINSSSISMTMDGTSYTYDCADGICKDNSYGDELVAESRTSFSLRGGNGSNDDLNCTYVCQ